MSYSNDFFFWAELDALEADMGTEVDGVPSYLQPDTESDLDSELNLPSAPTGQAAVPAGRSNAQVNSIDFLQKQLVQDIRVFCWIEENCEEGTLEFHEKVLLINPPFGSSTNIRLLDFWLQKSYLALLLSCLITPLKCDSGESLIKTDYKKVK